MYNKEIITILYTPLEPFAVDMIILNIPFGNTAPYESLQICQI
jgi:hypothetical protein